MLKRLIFGRIVMKIQRSRKEGFAMEKWCTESIEALFRAILTLKTEDECRCFFEDICTVKEMQEIAQRLSVADMLSKKKVYNEIARETGASTATISRVNRCLSYGSGGYELVLKRLQQTENPEGGAKDE